MKTKLFLLSLAMVLYCIMLVEYTLAQPSVKFKLTSETQTSANSVQCDLYIENTGGSTVSYLYCQAYINYSSSVLNSGSASCSYVSSSSDLPVSHTALFSVGVSGTGPSFKISYTGSPPIANAFDITASSSLKLATLEFSTDASSFAIQTLGAAWRQYDGSDPKTKFFYVDGGVATELTSSGNYSYFVVDPEPILPIELTTFTGSADCRNITLLWKTKTEINSYGFEVERSLTHTLSQGEGYNGSVKVGFVQASGNSSSPKEYSFVDQKLKPGKYNYRLKMIDNDGTFEYSSIVEVEVGLPKEYAISQNYPNPFNPTTRIDYQLPFDSKVTLELYAITGERVATIINEVFAAGYYSADINTSKLNLASGVYVCRMIAQNQSQQNDKIFIQNKKLMLLK